MLTMTKRKKRTAARQSFAESPDRDQEKRPILEKPNTKDAIYSETAAKSNNPAASPAPAAITAPPPVAALAGQHRITVHHVDRPDTRETFADAIGGAYFDGQTLRIEFAVTRLDEAKADHRSRPAAFRCAGSSCRHRRRWILSTG